MGGAFWPSHSKVFQTARGHERLPAIFMGSTASRLRPSVHPGPLHSRLPTFPRCSSSSSDLKQLQSWRTSPHLDHREIRVVPLHTDGRNTPFDGLGVHGMVGSLAAVTPSEVMRTSRGRSVTQLEVIMVSPPSVVFCTTCCQATDAAESLARKSRNGRH